MWTLLVQYIHDQYSTALLPYVVGIINITIVSLPTPYHRRNEQRRSEIKIEYKGTIQLAENYSST